MSRFYDFYDEAIVNLIAAVFVVAFAIWWCWYTGRAILAAVLQNPQKAAEILELRDAQ